MATETTAAGNESAFLYRLLVSPAFRWMRYLILVMVLGTISFNQVFIIFMDYRDILGVWIYVFTFIYMLTYVGVICLNLFWLFPKYLLKRHYMTYLSVLSVAMVIALLIQMVIEYLAYSHWPQLHARGSYFSVPMLMDYISSFMLSTLCMIGGTMTLLLKEWMIENQRVSQMEKAHVLSEVEQLKEQVSPELLFKTLHHSGELTLTEPEKASKMLMKLSQLLRYQLYDCSRQKVLLSSEIAFLTNYLTLEQSSLPQFRYQFTSEGEVNRMLVPPLLFIPFVQHIMELTHEQQILLPVSLDIHLKAEKATIVFTCMCPQLNLSVNRGLERIRQRLDLLYGDRYGLSLTTECIRLELNDGTMNGKSVTAFLLSPHCRIYRHILLQVAVLLITINVFWYEPLQVVSLLKRFGGCLVYFLSMNAVIYTNLYVLVPSFLLKNRLGGYVLAAIVTNLVVIFFLSVTQGMLFEVILPVRNPDGFATFINTFSGILTMGFVTAGSAAISLFTHWLRHNLRIDQLESTTLQSELKFLTSQINPHFLFNMLNNANVLIKRNPEEASKVLFKLEDLLRYQINDSSRERVALASDIRFLNDYLNLEKIRRDHFQFTMEQEGDIGSIWIQPLLFIPFVENAVKHSFDSEHPSYVHLSFKVEENRLEFRCENTMPAVAVSNKVGGIGLANIQRRLGLLYPDRYELEQIENENRYMVTLCITL